MKSARLLAIVGALVIGASAMTAAGPASASSSVFANPSATPSTADLDIAALGIEYTAEALTIQASVENFTSSNTFVFNAYLTQTQRTINDDPNYLNVSASVSNGAPIITATTVSNGQQTGPGSLPGATITVENSNLITLTIPAGGAVGNASLFAWASLSTPDTSVDAGIPVVGGIVGFGPINSSVVSTTTTARLTTPSQVHNSTPATVLVSVSPSHGNGVIDIMDGAKVVASDSYNGADVAINLPKNLPYGAHTLIAVYRPSTPLAYGGSASAPLQFRVLSGGIKTSTAVSVSKSSQRYKKTAAIVKVHVSHKPSGKVVIFDGKKKLKTLTLKKGAATYTLSKKLAKGTHRLHAEFTPKNIDSYAPSVSKTKTLKVSR